MPLSLSTLQSALEDVFKSQPANRADAAAAWADAFSSYAAGVVPASTTVSAAEPTLASALVGAFGSTDPATTATQMEAAFLAFATTVGTGMTGAGFAGTPPPAPVGIAALLASNKPSPAAAAADWAAALDTWMHTGIATLIAPPFTPQPWS